jgi:hypothetical protein
MIDDFPPLAVFNTVLQADIQIGEILPVEFLAIRQLKPELARQEPLECCKPLSPVDHYEAPVGILRHVEHR